MTEAEKVLAKIDEWDRCWPGNIYIQDTMEEAADLIRRLQAENESLSNDNKYLLKINQNLQRELTRLETLHYP